MVFQLLIERFVSVFPGSCELDEPAARVGRIGELLNESLACKTINGPANPALLKAKALAQLAQWNGPGAREFGDDLALCRGGPAAIRCRTLRTSVEAGHLAEKAATDFQVVFHSSD